MATAQRTRPAAQSDRMVLRNISWETYEHLLADHENASAPRFTYDRGNLEIVSPLSDHEEVNRAIQLIVELVLAERNTHARNLGSTTFRRKDVQRGFEPDSSFYIQRASAIHGKRRIDLQVDPAPDLVIEIDITHSSLDKLAIFAALGVSEVWRYDTGRIDMFVLDSGGYVPVEESQALPGVSANDVSMLVAAVESLNRATWIRRVQTWAHELPTG